MDGIPGITLSFFWGARAIPIHQCSQTLLGFLDHLEDCCPLLKSWNGVRPRAHALPRNQASIETELLKGVNRRETDGSPILELGYSFSLVSASKKCRWWNFRVHCSDYSDAVPNECITELGTYEPYDVNVLNKIDWRKLVDGIVKIWVPDHGRVSTLFARQPMIAAPFSVGWLTYLSNEKFPELPAFSEGTPIRELKGFGRFVGALPKTFPEHSDEELHVLTSIHESFAAMFGKVSPRKRKR